MFNNSCHFVTFVKAMPEYIYAVCIMPVTIRLPATVAITRRPSHRAIHRPSCNFSHLVSTLCDWEMLSSSSSRLTWYLNSLSQRYELRTPQLRT